MNIDEFLNKTTLGDAFELIKAIPDKSVNLVITSPPYFNQRIYTDSPCEIGRESNIDEYLEKLIEIIQQCYRVIQDDGSIILNVGDKYIESNLMLVPWRLALLVQQKTKLTLINQVTWVKQNPTPRQFTRRMVNATEPFFHWVKNHKYKYYYDRLATSGQKKFNTAHTKIGEGYYNQIQDSDLTPEQKKLAVQELDDVIEEIKAGKLTSLRMKIKGKHSLPFGGQEGGRKTQIETKGFTIIRVPGNGMVRDVYECAVENIKGINHPAIYPQQIVEHFITLTTDINDVVLDPFMGSGTTMVGAQNLKRKFIGFELNQDFIVGAEKRVETSQT
jgi:site-specific DNA-methyltransferase (adenine-specific)